MTLIKKCYTELLALTQLYLLREHKLYEMIVADPGAAIYFQKKMSSPSLNLAKHPPIHRSPQPINQPSKVALHSPPNSVSRSPALPSPVTPPRQNSSPTQLPSISSNVQENIPLLTKSTTYSNDPNNKITFEGDKSNHSPTSRGELESAKINQQIPNNMNIQTKGIALEPLKALSYSYEDHEFWKLFPKLFPKVKLYESIPNDSHGIKLKNRHDDHAIPPIILLTFQEDDKQLAFLKNVAQAISLCLAPARILSATKIEKERGWENVLKSSTLRLVIASNNELYLQQGLMHFYQENSQLKKYYLNRIPLLLLSNLSLYLKEPQLKPLLWQAICNEFATSQS